MEEQQKAINKFVNDKIQMLANSHNPSYVRATLAKLRRGVGKRPADLPDIWDFTLDLLPDEFLSKTGIPTNGQWATFLSLTLFALHQQGKDINENPMSEAGGNSLGNAVRDLTNKRGEESADAIKRRFDIVVTSSSAEELAYHLRSMISLLRGESIPLDYPRLAEDIFNFQSPVKRDGVKLRWGQDYYTYTRKDGEENEK